MNSTDDKKLDFWPEPENKKSEKSEMGSLNSILGDSGSLLDFDFDSMAPSLDNLSGEDDPFSSLGLGSLDNFDLSSDLSSSTENKTEDKSDDKKPESSDKKPESSDKSDDKKSDDKPSEKSDDKKSDDKKDGLNRMTMELFKVPKNKSDDKKSDDKPSEKSDDKKSDDKASEKSDDKKSDTQSSKKVDDKKSDDKKAGLNRMTMELFKVPKNKSDDKPFEKSDAKKLDNKSEDKKGGLNRMTKELFKVPKDKSLYKTDTSKDKSLDKTDTSKDKSLDKTDTPLVKLADKSEDDGESEIKTTEMTTLTSSVLRAVDSAEKSAEEDKAPVESAEKSDDEDDEKTVSDIRKLVEEDKSLSEAAEKSVDETQKSVDETQKSVDETQKSVDETQKSVDDDEETISVKPVMQTIEFGEDSSSSNVSVTREPKPEPRVSQSKMRVVPSATVEFGDDEPAQEFAPDMSNAPVIEKSEFERTLVFENNENRWDDAEHFVLPKPGDKVGNYQIISELGRGGFGAVYKAKNLNLGREEALKLILPSAKNECIDIEKRFHREIDIVSRLEHPNIVRLYSSGVLDRGVIWMTMELVRGDRLDDRLAQYGGLHFGKVRNLMCQLLCGLQEAHRHQIVHRDLKPANIILSKKEGYSDQVVILDFGLSKAIGSGEDAEVQELTSVDSRRIYGTPQYMAPEQLNRGKLGPWTDVYAAGLIFYELLTGKPAIDGDSLFDVAFKQAYEPIEIPEAYRDTAIEVILNKACAKNPASRYKDAGDFFDALQHVEDETDPPSVLNNEKRGGRNLSDIGMLHKTRTAESTNETQIGLTAIQQETLVRHTEPTGGHRRYSSITLVGIGFLVIVALIIVIIAIFALTGLIDLQVKF